MLIKASHVYGIGLSLLAISAFGACSSDPDNSNTGTAGTSTGTAGTLGTAGTNVGTAGTNVGTAGTNVGTAGTNGTAGTGTGGSGGGSSTACAGMKPASALITEFADLAPNPTSAGQFIFTLGVPGGTFSYEKPAITVADTGMALNAKGMVSTYSGFGVYLNACTDASAYTGVSFSIKGTLPAMKTTVNFRVQTSKNTKIDTVNKKGECVGTTYEECHDGGVDVMVGTDAKTVEVKFSELMGGVPSATVSGKDVLGFEWAFAWAGMTDTAYAADVTIDNLKFTGGSSGGTGAGGSAGSGGSGGSAAGSGGSGGSSAGSGGTGGTN